MTQNTPLHPFLTTDNAICVQPPSVIHKGALQIPTTHMLYPDLNLPTYTHECHTISHTIITISLTLTTDPLHHLHIAGYNWTESANLRPGVDPERVRSSALSAQPLYLSGTPHTPVSHLEETWITCALGTLRMFLGFSQTHRPEDQHSMRSAQISQKP